MKFTNKINNFQEYNLRNITENTSDDSSMQLKNALGFLHNDCVKFEQLKKSPTLNTTCFMTDLDKYRLKLCNRKLVSY